jgi:hypothetical protein
MHEVTRQLVLTMTLTACLSSTGCSGCRSRPEDVTAVSAEQTEGAPPKSLKQESPAPAPAKDSSGPNSVDSSSGAGRPPAGDTPNGTEEQSPPGSGTGEPGTGEPETGEPGDEGTTSGAGTTRSVQGHEGSSGSDRESSMHARCRGMNASDVRQMAAKAAEEGDYGTAFGFGAIAWERLSATPAGPARDRLERQLRIDLETWDKLANAKTSGDRRKTLIDAP